MSLSTAPATTSTDAREVIPAAERTLCAWCNTIATRNLDTYHDVCCDAHYAQWFAGPDAAPACDCRLCEHTATVRALVAANS